MDVYLYQQNFLSALYAVFSAIEFSPKLKGDQVKLKGSTVRPAPALNFWTLEQLREMNADDYYLFE